MSCWSVPDRTLELYSIINQIPAPLNEVQCARRPMAVSATGNQGGCTPWFSHRTLLEPLPTPATLKSNAPSEFTVGPSSSKRKEVYTNTLPLHSHECPSLLPLTAAPHLCLQRGGQNIPASVKKPESATRQKKKKGKGKKKQKSIACLDCRRINLGHCASHDS